MTYARLIFILLLALWCPGPLLAAVCTLTWDQNTDSAIVGYHVYESLVSQGYTHGQYVGTVGTPGATCDQLGIIADGLIHYFVVTDYTAANAESDFSNEVSIQLLNIPPTPPTCLHFNPHGRCTKWSQ